MVEGRGGPADTATSHRIDRPFIGGVDWHPHSTHTFTAINPADGEAISEVVDSDEADVDAAVETAAAAQSVWAQWSPSRRGEVLLRWSELIGEQRQQLATLDTANMGKPLNDTLNDIAGAVSMVRYWAGMADKITGDQIPVTPGHLSYTLREPIGVCAIVLPWNGPAVGVSSRAAPALACGNAVVVKPSEWSPLSAVWMARLAVEAGMPAGLVNVVTGKGATGAALAAHPGVAGVTFTGSVSTGRKIAHAAADTFKNVILELGGKSPNIVFDDANLDAALAGSAWGVFYNAGQVCVAGTRLLVQRSIAERFTRALVNMAERVRVGDPMDRTIHIGPVVSAPQHQRVLEYLEIGRSEGAQLLTGGGRPDGTHPNGYFVSPAIFSEVMPEMRIAREEIFGPVLSVLTFEDEEEALSIANGVDYGLSATIWTSDVGRMLRTADRLDSGTIQGNTMRLNHPGLPFGGFKDSGMGNAYAQGAIDGSTRVKRVSIRFDDTAPAPGWSDLGG